MFTLGEANTVQPQGGGRLCEPLQQGTISYQEWRNLPQGTVRNNRDLGGKQSRGGCWLRDTNSEKQNGRQVSSVTERTGERVEESGPGIPLSPGGPEAVGMRWAAPTHSRAARVGREQTWKHSPSHTSSSAKGRGLTSSRCLHRPSNQTLPNVCYKHVQRGASLTAQWLRIHLLMQGTRVQSLVQEDPTCCRVTKPVRHNY